MNIAPGSTSVSVYVHLSDAVTGADATAVTALVTGVFVGWQRDNSEIVLMDNLSVLASVSQAWEEGRFGHVLAGTYRVDPPNFAFAPGASILRVYAGSPGVVQTGGPLELVSLQSVVSAAEVSAQRTWLFAKHGRDHHAENTLVLNASASNVLTLAFDCTSLLNPDTSLASVSSVTLTPADTGPAITATSLAIDTSQRKAMFRVTGFTTADTYTVTATVATNDSQTLVIKGVLRVVS